MDNKITDKIKKLLALSKSPNENEALLAYQRAQELLTKHNISQDDVQVDFNILEDTIWIGEQLEEWKFILYSVVADCNYCKLVLRSFSDKTFKYTLIGKVHNITIVKEMCQYLLDTTEKLCKEKAEQLNIKYKKLGLMLTALADDSLRIGIVKGIASRLLAKKKQMQDEGIRDGSENESGKNTTALSISKLYDDEISKINQYLNSQFGDVKQITNFDSDYIEQFIKEGQQESRKIGLNKQIKGGTNDKI